jgi:hypothetical protein
MARLRSRKDATAHPESEKMAVLSEAPTHASTKVNAAINYIRNPRQPGQEALTFVTADERKSTMITLPGVSVEIEDMRGTATSIDVEGFELLRHVSTVPNFDRIEEDEAIDQLYIDEMTALVKKITGAPIVIMQGGGKKRYGQKAQDKLDGLMNALPALYPHGDTTEASAVQLAMMMASFATDVNFEDFSRWQHINLWRAITLPPHDYPLAVCDARTLSLNDAVTVIAKTETRATGSLEFETHGYLYNPAHRWCYFSNMNPEEVLMFKTHDSDPTHAHQVAHSAFLNSLCPPDAPTRGSVEMRAFVAYL